MNLNIRRLPILLVVVLALTAIVVATRSPAKVVDPVFSRLSASWMPFAPEPGGLSTTWYCPGVPAAPKAATAAEPDAGSSEAPADTNLEDAATEPADRTAGEVHVFNPDEDPMIGSITVTRESGDPLVEEFEIAGFGSQVFDIDALVESAYAAAIVEIEGGGGLVEQKATWPVGTNSVADSVSPCTNAPADQWYFATGDTSAGSQDLLVLSNPHDHTAVVDVTLSTSRGPRQIDKVPVPAKSVRTIDLRNHTVNDEVNVGATVIATRGTLIAARAQTYDTPDRDGYSMVLGATEAREQWWFAAGEKGDDVVTEYAIYNPGEDDAIVHPLLLGFEPGSDFVQPSAEGVTVPAGTVKTFTYLDLPGIPDGPVAAVFGTEEGLPIVVERTFTRTINGIRTTSVSPGATPRTDNYIANTWYLGIGAPTEGDQHGYLQLYNPSSAEGVVTVQRITPTGVETIPAYEAVALGRYAALRIDLDDPATQGVPLIIRATTSVFVERVLPREQGARGRVASWLLPAG